MKRIFANAALPRWAEVIGMIAIIYVIDRVYNKTGAPLFEDTNWYFHPIPLLVPLLPFLVYLWGPALKKGWAAVHKRVHAVKAEVKVIK